MAPVCRIQLALFSPRSNSKLKAIYFQILQLKHFEFIILSKNLKFFYFLCIKMPCYILYATNHNWKLNLEYLWEYVKQFVLKSLDYFRFGKTVRMHERWNTAFLRYSGRTGFYGRKRRYWRCENEWRKNQRKYNS